MGRRNKRAVRCDGCRMHHDLCICDQLVPVPTRSHWVVVEHAREQHRTTNTGHLVSTLLDGCQRCIWQSRVDPPVPAPVLAPDREALLLFPVEGVTPIDPAELAERADELTVVVLDGSWGEARKMARWLDLGRPARALGLPAQAAPRYVLRERTVQDGLCTADAVSWVLQALGDVEAAAALIEGLRLAAERIHATRGTPLPGGARIVRGDLVEGGGGR